MATGTISKYTAYGVSFTFTATSGTVTRTSATQYTVKIDASWSMYWSGNATYCGVSASSGNNSVVLNPNSTKASSGSGSFTGTYSISGNVGTNKSVVVTFTVYDPTTGSTASTSTTITLNVTVPTWTYYVIKFNTNGGSGALSDQVKWKDQTLTLTTTKPTRTGYTFLGWATSSTATSAKYSAGGSYTANSAATLYAVWKIVTYTIKFNANGGSGAPSSQTKSYGVTLTLPTTKPTRTNYNFLGWATSSTATSAKYSAGGSYTANSAATLYAVWELAYIKPRITDVSVTRSDSSGNASDEGQNGLVSFSWACDKTVSSIVIKHKLSSGSTWTSTTVSASDTIGTVSQVIGSDGLSIENTYDVQITVTDSGGSSSVTSSLPSMTFPIDIKSGGTGVAFGKTAEADNLADFAYQAKFGGGILQPVLPAGTDLNDVLTPNVYSGQNITSVSYSNVPFTKGSFTLRVEAAGPSGQIKQTITICDKTSARIWERFYYNSLWGKWKCVYDMSGTVLWSGSAYMTSDQTITLPEPVSSQPSGISLVFSEYYNSEAIDDDFTSFFISKKVVSAHGGCGHCFSMTDHGLEYFATKYLYITDDSISGHKYNSASGTGVSGITYTNTHFVLRYVIGV